MKAIIYARVSTKEQEKEGYSIEAQIDKCREMAKREAYVVSGEFIDVESAKRAGRTNFNKMIEFVKKNSIDVIICHKVDRLCRNFKDFVTVDELKIKPLFVEEEFSDNAAGKLTFGLKVLLAKHYIDNLSDEVKKGMWQKLMSGAWSFKAPYGYRNTGPKGIIEVEPGEAQNIHYLFRNYSTGNFSLQTLREKFKADGLIYNANKPTMAASQLYYILNNPIYHGVMRVNGEYFPGKHQPIISKEMFAEVQKVFKSQNKPKKTVREFAFSGMIICSNCGCAITSEIKKGKFVYYHCTNYHGNCKKVYVREEDIEKMFDEAVKKLVIGESFYDMIVKTLKESHKDELEFHSQATARLRKRQNLLKERIAKCYEDKLDGLINHNLWFEKTSAWQAEVKKIDHELKAHSDSNYSYLEKGILIIELAKNAYSSYIQQDRDQKRKMLQILLSNSTLDGRNLHYTYKKPFNWLVEGSNHSSWWASLDEFRNWLDSNPDLTILDELITATHEVA